MQSDALRPKSKAKVSGWAVIGWGLFSIVIILGFISALFHITKSNPNFLSAISSILWPIVVLILFPFLLYHFKSPILEFLGRLRRGKFGGAEFHLAPGQVRSPEDISPSLRGQTAPSDRQQLPEYIRTRLELMDVAEGQLDDSQKIELLKRALVSSNIQVHHIWSFSNIYGTQIRALSALEVSGPISIKSFYDEFVQLSSTNPGFPVWVNFLIQVGYVEAMPDEKFKLTQFGKNFLDFVRQYYSNIMRAY